MKNISVKISGIKCDNHKCDFKYESVLFENYPDWLNKPCPKCGQNLLTQADYDSCKILLSYVKAINKLPVLSRKTKNILFL